MLEGSREFWGSPNTLVPRESPFLCILFAVGWQWGAAGLAQQTAKLKLLGLLSAFFVWHPTD